MPSEPLLPALFGPTSRPGPHRAADYFALETEERHELIHGTLHVSPSPIARHQGVLLALGARLREQVRKRGDLVFLAPLDTVLSELTVVQPDLLLVRAERLDVVKDRIEGAPDLVVEVLSPSTAARDGGEKLAEYAKAGVQEVWLVDPFQETVTFLGLHEGSYVVDFATDGIHRSPRFPEVTLDLAAFWNEVRAELGPPT